MGLFSRHKSGYDESEYQNYPEYQGQQQAPAPQPKATAAPSYTAPPPAQQQQQPQQQQHAAPSKQKRTYSIEDAILLMRDLPKSKKDMVVTIVAKTLESANISIGKIVNDAQKKLTSIETRTKKLHDEIREYEAGIAERRKEIEKLQEDHNETSAVKDSFESLEAEQAAKKNEAAPSPKQPRKEKDPTVNKEVKPNDAQGSPPRPMVS